MMYFCDENRHLVCKPYSIVNLHTMAQDLNINKCWYHSGDNPHYDIPKRRINEIINKCTVISAREVLNIIQNK